MPRRTYRLYLVTDDPYLEDQFGQKAAPADYIISIILVVNLSGIQLEHSNIKLYQTLKHDKHKHKSGVCITGSGEWSQELTICSHRVI